MNELLYFLRGAVADVKHPKRENLDWIDNATWRGLDSFQNLNEKMHKVGMHFKAHTDIWKVWIGLERPEDSGTTDVEKEKLSDLEKLLVVRIF